MAIDMKMAAAADLYEALRELREQCSKVSPFVDAVTTKSSVKDVRRIGKFLAACDRADAALAKAEGRA